MMTFRTLAVCGLMVLAAGCAKKDKTEGAGATGSAAAEKGGPKGLAATGNDPAIVAAANKVLTCTWKADSLHFDSDCAAWKAWTESSDIFKTAGADATFVNMAEDPDVKVRLMGVYHLGVDSERKWVNDPALSSRVIAAAAAETQNHWEVDEQGKALARIQYAKTGNWDKAKAAIEGTALKTMREWAYYDLLDYNETNNDVWNYLAAKTKEADKTEARWAVDGFKGMQTRKQEACKIFGDLLNDDKLGGHVASELTYQSHECTSYLGPVLDKAEAHVKDASMSDSDWAWAMSRLAENIKSEDAQKKRAIKILGEMIENKHIEGYVRSAAIWRLYDVDKGKAKSAAAKYAKDTNSSVAGAAKDVLAKKS